MQLRFPHVWGDGSVAIRLLRRKLETGGFSTGVEMSHRVAFRKRVWDDFPHMWG